MRRTTAYGGSGFQPLESACNAPSGRTVQPYRSWGKKEGSISPSSDYSSFFSSPFLLETVKNEQVFRELSTDLTTFQMGHVTVIRGGGHQTTPLWGHHWIEKTLLSALLCIYIHRCIDIYKAFLYDHGTLKCLKITHWIFWLYYDFPYLYQTYKHQSYV